jgi:hypothetical protein
MAQAEVDFPPDVVERNLALSAELMRYLLDQPQIFHALPDQFELVILPEDDPEIRRYNLELLDRYGSEGRAVVFARVRRQESGSRSQPAPSIFVPIAV